jgi:hypothetical protein
VRRAIFLVLVAAALARAEDPQEPPPQQPRHERSMDIDKPDAGFGQEEDEPRLAPRIRIEASGMVGWFDSEFRYGKSGLSNRFDPEGDLGVPRFTHGERVAGEIKLHRYFAIGGEYFHLGAEGTGTLMHSDFRLGLAPSEVIPGTYAKAAIELQQASFTLRFIAADDNEIRAEFCGGVTWVSFRTGLHPQLPLPLFTNAQGQLPGGGFYKGDSEANEAWLAPAIGTFFAWNFHPHVAIFFDTCSSYFSFWRTFGSIATIDRGGFRFRVAAGIEVTVAAFFVSGQVYDFRDRLAFIGVGSSHIFRQASWIGGGPELGLSLTY